MKKLRERIKNDPEMYEEYKKKERERYKARKEAGTIKSVQDLSERERRNIRKRWRQRSKRSYDAKKNQEKNRENMEMRIREYTPPSTPFPDEQHIIEAIPDPSRQAIQGKLAQRRNREHMKKEIDLLKEKLNNAEKKFVNIKQH